MYLKAPAGKKVEVKLLNFSPKGVGVDGCKYDGVEIKTQADQRLTGYRFVRVKRNVQLSINLANQ